MFHSDKTNIKCMSLQIGLEGLQSLAIPDFEWQVVPQWGGSDYKSPVTKQVSSRGRSRSSIWEEERRLRAGTYSWSRSLRYTGPVPHKAWKASTSILTWIQCAMGSQCRDLSTVVICSLTPVSVMSRAALFCMHCILRRRSYVVGREWGPALLSRW